MTVKETTRHHHPMTGFAAVHESVPGPLGAVTLDRVSTNRGPFPMPLCPAAVALPSVPEVGYL